MNAKEPSNLVDEEIDLSAADFARLLRAAAILVVDDDLELCRLLRNTFEDRCALLEVARSAEEAETLRRRYHFDVLIVDIRLPGMSGLEWLSELRSRGVRTRVILVADSADLDMAVRALRAGAEDIILKPLRLQQIVGAVGKILMQWQIQRDNPLLRPQLRQRQAENEFIGESDVMLQLLSKARQSAMVDSSVLIEGEAGTGKRLLAHTVHKLSRRKGAFVATACASLQASSEEDVLFGSNGMFARANKGTLVMVDVETLSPAMQARFVHMLEHSKYGRAGPSNVNPWDVRVLATTNADLSLAVGTRQFRNDLYYKLNALPLSIPALRGRVADIQLLADTFMQRLAASHALTPLELLHEDRERLDAYHWPGNVRELRNVIERTLLAGELSADNFPAEARTDDDLFQKSGFPLDYDLERVERLHIEAVMGSVGNNKSAASRILGVSRKTLERKQALWYGKRA